DAVGEPAEITARERGVAAADEHEVAADGVPVESAGRVDSRLDPRCRRKGVEERERQRELLGRRRLERKRVVERKELLPRPQVDGDGGRARRRYVRHAKGFRKPRLQRGLGPNRTGRGRDCWKEGE